jgi:hypothetical protein
MSTVKEPQNGGEEGMRGAVEFSMMEPASGPPLGIFVPYVEPTKAVQRMLPMALRPLLTKPKPTTPAPVAPPHVQPIPLATIIVRPADGGNSTGITYVWGPGDVARCMGCPKGACHAVCDIACAWSVPGRLNDEQARAWLAAKAASLSAGAHPAGGVVSPLDNPPGDGLSGVGSG